MRTLAPRRLLATLALLGAVPATAAHAQAPAATPDTTPRDSLPDTTAAQTLGTVRVVANRRASYVASGTVTATRTPTLLRDVPQSVTTISRGLIADVSMQGLADVVRFVPG